MFGILLDGHKAQMIWSNTGCCMAEVVNNLAVWDLADVPFVGKPMREKHSSVMTEHSVAPRPRDRPEPSPAFARLIDLVPEPSISYCFTVPVRTAV